MMLLLLINHNVQIVWFQINKLLSLVDYHWHIFMHSVEVQIMHDYAVIERKATIFLVGNDQINYLYII